LKLRITTGGVHLQSKQVFTLLRNTRFTFVGIYKEWREQFIKSGEEGFKSRQKDNRPEEARQVIGDLTMENELLKKKIELKERTRDK